jgi:hypothetical protein
MKGTAGVGCWVFGVRCSAERFPLPGTEYPTPNTQHRTPNTVPLLALALGVLVASPATANDGVALLRRGERAERSTRYTGIKLIWACSSGDSHHHSDYQRSARIWHDGPGRTRLEFVPTDGGPARVVVENGSHRWFFSPRRRAWRPVSWRAPEPRLDLLLRNYRVRPGSIATVAGRRALMVRVEPRFPGNPHKQAWLDIATGITLRADLYDSSGRLVSRSEFLKFDPERSLPASLFQVPDGTPQTADAGPDRRTPERLQRARLNPGTPEARLSFDPALPHYLPPGYVLTRLTRTRAEGTEVAWALFTDGLNTVSLVQWRGPREPRDGGRERFWGPGDRLRWNIGPINAMLAGDLAAAELKRIAGSIRSPRQGAGSLVTRK